MNLEVARRDSRAWQAGIRLLQSVYRAQYGAHTNPAPGTVLILTDQDVRQLNPGQGLVGAVAGLNFANEGRLFSEHYLTEPVDQLVSARTGEEVSRSEIVEVGPLGSTTTGAGSQLISLLAPMCWCQGAKIAVFTVTRPLHLMLTRAGISTEDLASPREDQLPPELQGIWGTYYKHKPVTLVCDIAQNMGDPLALMAGAAADPDLAGRG